MIVYIYELGLMKIGYVKDVSDNELKDHIQVGDYTLLTIESDLTQTAKVIKACVKKYA